MQFVKQPIRRSRLRAALGMACYGALRRVKWLAMERRFALLSGQTMFKRPIPDAPKSARQGGGAPLLPCVQFAHKTPLLRKLKDVEMWYQHNKIINLRIAVPRLNGVVLRPGQIFSYWRLIGKPTKRKGYVPGMVLKNGTFCAETGGGLCQLSNLIFWMALHTPLTVVERHRHGYDVFPDANRTQPFGSGATCFYPHGDLMLRNDTAQSYQLVLRVGETHLEGEWRAETPPAVRYRVVEKHHTMQSEYWGGYSRHNELYREVYDAQNKLLGEEFILSNAAIMMYAPFLPQGE